jgi:Protein of unknown function (DUF3800)
VSFVEAYFDESGSHDDSPVLCVAGHIIRQDARIKLDAEWQKVLQQFKLPFFRMSACANGSKPFDVLTIDQRIDAEKQLIAITKQYISYGIAITVIPKLYREITPDDPEITGTPYSFLAHACLAAVSWWATERKCTGQIAYHFESGHRSRSEADRIMQRLFRQPKLREKHRYISHAFAEKKATPALQAADLIAWHWYTDEKRRITGSPVPSRKDCVELMMTVPGLFHALHYGRSDLQKVADTVLRGKYPLTFVKQEVEWRRRRAN